MRLACRSCGLQVIDQMLRPEVREGNLHLTWLLRASRPTYCYGLNRFLVEIALLAYATKSKRTLRRKTWKFDSPITDLPIVLVAHDLATIESADESIHKCDPTKAELCHQHPHVATVRPAVSTARKVRRTRKFDLVVVRHGLRPAALFGGDPVREQRMPYWLTDH